MKVNEHRKVMLFLEERNLLAQYKKAKSYFEVESFKEINFKKRRPKALKIWSFRINKKYRAIGSFRDEKFIVYRIDDHQ